MDEQKIIIGEFEDEMYAEVARRDLAVAGISATILKNNNDVFILFSEQDKAVRLVIPGTQIKKAKRILERKFICSESYN
jgi:hypothetical protein